MLEHQGSFLRSSEQLSVSSKYFLKYRINLHVAGAMTNQRSKFLAAAAAAAAAELVQISCTYVGKKRQISL